MQGTGAGRSRSCLSAFPGNGEEHAKEGKGRKVLNDLSLRKQQAPTKDRPGKLSSDAWNIRTYTNIFIHV